MIESLSPFEMTHRSYREAHETLLRLNEILEAEAGRIACSLHDESGQLLVAAHIALEDLVRHLPPGFEERAQKVEAALDDVYEQLRRLSHELRPPVLDDLRLLPALRFLADGFSKRTGLAVTVESSLRKRLPSKVESALYRIAQEALTNTFKHAKATRVSIQIRSAKGGLCCTIRDDGVGFASARAETNGRAKGLGLRGIRERIKTLGGSLEIESSRGQGTIQGCMTCRYKFFSPTITKWFVKASARCSSATDSAW